MRWLPVLLAALPLSALLLALGSNVGVSRSGLVISEIMYHPLPPSEEERGAGWDSASKFEFVELTNITVDEVLLSRIGISAGVQTDLELEPAVRVAAGASVLLVADTVAFRARYGESAEVIGEFEGELPDGGAWLALRVNGEDDPLQVHYQTGSRWPQTPRGLGFSLVLNDPSENPDHRVAEHWRASRDMGGSPGQEDPDPERKLVYINELLLRERILDTYHRMTTLPLLPDAVPSPDFILKFAEDMRHEPYHFSFIHMVGPDASGHLFGWGTEEQDEAIKAVDIELGVIFDLVDNDPALQNRTAIILTADHGGGGGDLKNHIDATYPINYTIPFYVWGPGIQAGADLYALNSATRTLPHEESNPAYSLETATMPIRNGDLGNLALNLLGLPAIPQSWINHDQSLQTGINGVDYVIAISVDGLLPESIHRLGQEVLPNLYRLQTEGAFTDNARTDATHTYTNPNHTTMLTSRGTLNHVGVGRGHGVTFNGDFPSTLQQWNGHYIASVFDVVKAFGKRASFYSGKSKLDFLARSYGAIGGDAIELHNPNNIAVDVGRWGLTDDPTEPDKFLIPGGVVIPPGGFVTLREDPGWRSPRGPDPVLDTFGSAFDLDPGGGALHLFAYQDGMLTGADHGLAYGPTFSDASLVRHQTADGDRFHLADVPTLSAENPASLVSPIVITEIGLHPGIPLAERFIELRNQSSANLTLGPSWGLTGDVFFVFPENLEVESGGMVVVAVDPASLIAAGKLPDAAILLGPLAIRNPQAIDLHFRLVIANRSLTGEGRVVALENVTLGDRSSWATWSEAGGRTLERSHLGDFADSPASWRLSSEFGGSPGFLMFGTYDDWVERHFTRDEASPGADPDADGSPNLFEYAFATDPLDNASKFEPQFESHGSTITLTYQRPQVALDLVYELERSTNLVDWQRSVSNVIPIQLPRALGPTLEEVTWKVAQPLRQQHLRLRVRLLRE